MAEDNTKTSETENGNSDTGSKLATVAAVALGVALIEIELIPGMLIGVAAMIAPRFLPRLGSSLRPLMKTAMRAGYATFEKTKEVMAEASEQFQDVAAEARHDQDVAQKAPARKTAAKKRTRASAA